MMDESNKAYQPLCVGSPPALPTDHPRLPSASRARCDNMKKTRPMRTPKRRDARKRQERLSCRSPQRLMELISRAGGLVAQPQWRKEDFYPLTPQHMACLRLGASRRQRCRCATRSGLPSCRFFATSSSSTSARRTRMRPTRPLPTRSSQAGRPPGRVLCGGGTARSSRAGEGHRGKDPPEEGDA